MALHVEPLPGFGGQVPARFILARLPAGAVLPAQPCLCGGAAERGLRHVCPVPG